MVLYYHPALRQTDRILFGIYHTSSGGNGAVILCHVLEDTNMLSYCPSETTTSLPVYV